MTKEEKELLIKDLCARTPYKVMGHVHTEDRADIIAPIVSMSPSGESVFVQDSVFAWFATLEQTKPYLRPMSSMTEEEQKELRTIFAECQAVEPGIGSSPWYCHPERKLESVEFGFRHTFKLIDWFNAHHFDYRGLIKNGLALEAPEGMYTF